MQFNIQVTGNFAIMWVPGVGVTCVWVNEVGSRQESIINILDIIWADDEEVVVAVN